MAIDVTPTLFIADLVGGTVASEEIRSYLEIGGKLIVNVHQRKDKRELEEEFQGMAEFVDVQLSASDISSQAEAFGGFDVIKLRRNISIDRQFFSSLSSLPRPLRILAQSGSGISHIDLSAADAHGVLVTHTPGANAQAVAELVIGLAITLSRSLHLHGRETSEGQWSKGAFPLGRELKGMVLGLVGVGRIGEALIPLAKGFGMKVAGYGGPRFTREGAELLGIEYCGSLTPLLQCSDVVSLHLPLTPETRHLIGGQEIGAMKEGAFLINVARGGIVDEEALCEEFSRPFPRLGGAALDVHSKEGDLFSSPLIGIPQVILTPHIGGSTIEALSEVVRRLPRQVASLLSGKAQGERIPVAVDKGVLL